MSLKSTLITILFLSTVCSISLNGQVQESFQKERSRQKNSGDFSLSVFENFEWLNTKNKKSIINNTSSIYLLVYINELDADFDLTFSYVNSLKSKDIPFDVLYIYNATTAQNREKRHLEQLVYNKGITDPIIFVNSRIMIDRMKIDDYPIAFIYSNRLGSLNYFEGLEEFNNIEKDILYVTEKLELKKETPVNRASTENISIPLVGQFYDIEAAVNKSWLFVSSPSSNRIWVIDEYGDLIDIIGNGSSGNKDGYYVNASFNKPTGLFWDKSTGILYVADTDNHAIRTVNYQDIEKPVVGTLLSEEKSRELSKNKETYPTDVEMMGNQLFITMSGINEVWIYDLETDQITRSGIAINSENGDSTVVDFYRPRSLTQSKKKGIFFLSNGSNDLINYNPKTKLFTKVKMDTTEFPLGQIIAQNKTVVATNPLLNQIQFYNQGEVKHSLGHKLASYKDGSQEEVRFNNPNGITFMKKYYYVTDLGNNVIRKIHSKSKKVTSLEIGEIDLMIEGKMSMEHEMEFTSPEIPTSEGLVTIEINFELGDQYMIVPHTKNQLIDLEGGLKSGTGITILDGDFNNGRARITVEGGELATYTRLRANLVYRDKMSPKNTYYKQINLTLIYGFDESADNKYDLKIPIN